MCVHIFVVMPLGQQLFQTKFVHLKNIVRQRHILQIEFNISDAIVTLRGGGEIEAMTLRKAVDINSPRLCYRT